MRECTKVVSIGKLYTFLPKEFTLRKKKKIKRSASEKTNESYLGRGPHYHDIEVYMKKKKHSNERNNLRGTVQSGSIESRTLEVMI